MRLSAIYVFPVKSLGGMSVLSATVTARGLDGDRRWMIVDGDGRFLTQREEPSLALIAARLDGETLELESPGSVLRLPSTMDGQRRMVKVWADCCEAVVSSLGSDFVSAFLGRDVELVFMPDDVERPVPSSAGDVVSFADGYPLLLIGQASLDELNRRLAMPVPMTRFRPNLVVDGAAPHAEDGWRHIRVGAVGMRVVKPCERCSITTVDDFGSRGREPLATLATYRRGSDLGWQGGVFFGMNVIHDDQGVITVGDDVTVYGRQARSAADWVQPQSPSLCTSQTPYFW